MLVAATLGLGKPLGSLAEFPWILEFSSVRQGQQGMETRIDADSLVCVLDWKLVFGIEPQVKVPARSPLDDPSALYPANRKLLLVKPDLADSGKPYPAVLWWLDRIGEGDGIEFVSDALKFGSFGD